MIQEDSFVDGDMLGERILDWDLLDDIFSGEVVGRLALSRSPHEVTQP